MNRHRSGFRHATMTCTSAVALLAAVILPLGCDDAGGSTGSTGNSGGPPPCVPITDNNPCTEEICEQGVLLHVPLADGLSCDDKDACSKMDACLAGVCTSSQLIACATDMICVAGGCTTCAGDLGRAALPVGAEPSVIVSGDLNGDLMPDLVVANAGEDSLSVLLALGHSAFAPAVKVSTGQRPVAIAIADLNADGQNDLAVVNTDSHDISILVNDGNGGFAAAWTIGAGTNPLSIVAADFNRDTLTDLAVANGGSDDVSVLLNQGQAVFAPKVDRAAGIHPSTLAVADVDGDEDPDLVVGCTGKSGDFDSSVAILRGDGQGGFAPKVEIPNVSIRPLSMQLVDLDGDTHVDLAYVGTSSIGAFDDKVEVRLNADGKGNFAQIDLSGNISDAAFVVTADLDSDGRLDLVTGREVFLNKPGNQFKAWDLGMGLTAVRAMTAADVNGDHAQDLAVVSDEVVELRLNHGAGAFLARADYPAGGAPNGTIAVDLNGDGKAEIVVANYASRSVGVFPNQGDGSFGAQVEYDVVNNAYNVGAGDLDGDGKLDLVAVNGGAWMLRNEGDGTFSPAIKLDAVWSVDDVAVADLNGDNKLDLAFCDATNGRMFVLINDGTGAFLPAIEAFAVNARRIHAADMNTDGKVDVALRTNTGLAVMYQQVDGSFAYPQDVYTLNDPSAPTSIELLDMNGDQKRDIVVVGYGVTLVLNQGGGAFATPIHYDAPVGGVSLAVADMNGDTKLDLVSTGYGGNQVSILLQNEDGSFLRHRSFSSGDGIGTVVAGDLDGDGRVDLAITNNNVSGVDADSLTVLRNVCVK